MAPKRPADAIPPSSDAKKQRPRGNSITDIVDTNNEQSVQDVENTFELVRTLVTTGILQDLDGFSEEIQQIVNDHMEDLQELKVLKQENCNEDIAFRSFSRLSENDYDRLGVQVLTKAPDLQSTDKFISSIKPKVSTGENIQGFWRRNVDVIVGNMLFIQTYINTTSEAACTALINEMMFSVMKFILESYPRTDPVTTTTSGSSTPHVQPNLIPIPIMTPVLFPQLGLSSRSDPAEIKTSEETSGVQVDSVGVQTRSKTRSRAANIKITVEKDGQALTRRTVLTGSVDYGLFVVSLGSVQDLVAGTNNMRGVFQSLPNRIRTPNFVLLEAKRKALGNKLDDYLPQVIGESLVALQVGDSNHVHWCLTTGYDWIFGLTAKKSNEDGFNCFVLAKDRIGVDARQDYNTSELKVALNRVFTILVHLSLESSGTVLDAMKGLN